MDHCVDVDAALASPTEPPVAEPPVLTAVESFDKGAVKFLAVAARLSVLMFLALIALSVALEQHRAREVVWCAVAWPMTAWSLAVIVRWERLEAPRLSWEQLAGASPQAAVRVFRGLFWCHLACCTTGVVCNSYLIFHCWLDYGEVANSRQCVLSTGSSSAWAGLVFSANSCYLFVSVLLGYFARLFCANTPAYSERFQAALAVIVLWTVVSLGLCVLQVHDCEFSRPNVFDQDYPGGDGSGLSGISQLAVACRPWFFLPNEGCKYAFRIYGIFWFCRLSGGCCRDAGLAESAIPRWVRLMSNFLLLALRPNTLAEAILPLLMYLPFITGGYVAILPLQPLLSQAIFNFYLFGCVPPGSQRFLWIRLTHVAKEITVPWTLVRSACGYANDSYYDDPTLQEPTNSGVAPLTQADSDPKHAMRFVSCQETDTHAQLRLSQDGMLAIAFRGTGSLANVSTDCSVARTRMVVDSGLVFEEAEPDSGRAQSSRASAEGCMVHGGFARAYLSVRDELLAAHAELCLGLEQTSVVICGHSLGGALATLCTLELLARRLYLPNQVYMITFGQPRVGNHAFARHFDRHSSYDRCLRIVFNGDIVAGIPKFLCLFKHIGVEVEIKASGQVLCNPSPLERQLIKTTQNQFTSHLLGTYEAGIEACLSRATSDASGEAVANSEASNAVVLDRDCTAGRENARICAWCGSKDALICSIAAESATSNLCEEILICQECQYAINRRDGVLHRMRQWISSLFTSSLSDR